MNLHHPGARREGMLIQSMVTGDVVETIAGVNRDPAFGSAVVVGLGGIFVELLRDVSLELAPLSPARAKAMINRLQAAKLLQGFRGKQPADIAALEETLVRLGRMAHALGERLVSRSQSSHGVAGRTGGTHRGHRDAGPAFRRFPQAPSVTLEK